MLTTHPGESVLYDCLEPLGLSITEGATHLGVSEQELADLVECRSSITPEMAIRLDGVFGGGAYTWYRLQEQYDIAQGVKSDDEAMTIQPMPNRGLVEEEDLVHA